MKRAILTLSGLQQASLCPGSAVLPRIGSTSKKKPISAPRSMNTMRRGRTWQASRRRTSRRHRRSLGSRRKDRAVFFGRARSMDLGIPDGALVPKCRYAFARTARSEPVEGGQGAHGARRRDRCRHARYHLRHARPDRGRYVVPARQRSLDAGLEDGERRTRGTHCTELAGSSVRAARCKVDRSRDRRAGDRLPNDERRIMGRADKTKRRDKARNARPIAANGPRANRDGPSRASRNGHGAIRTRRSRKLRSS